MKVLITLGIVTALGSIFFLYTRDKNLKKLLLSLATLGTIIALAVIGNVTRPMIPLFIAHLLFSLIAWGGLLLYVWRDRYYWWAIFSPIVPIGLFLLLELLIGSRHEPI